jgi:hypothetical protein
LSMIRDLILYVKGVINSLSNPPKVDTTGISDFFQVKTLSLSLFKIYYYTYYSNNDKVVRSK